ncbi:MAG TPA: hypothetical protein VFO62_03850 [Candidatus Binatia bacterium]|nr:hypothetical protein [Candidatus Binatia bacterium]
MIAETCQRWTEKHETRRPSGETIRASAYDAIAIDPSTAVAFVRRHHYARECSSRSHTFGLYQRGELAGVAVFGALPSMNAHRKVFPTLGTKVGVTLGRFVLVDSVPGNGESWFIARCFDLLRERGVVGVESCADPTRGHIGTIYQATNGRYVGKTNPATRYLLPDGTELSNRAASKLTGGERGDGRAIAQLVSFGADAPQCGEDLVAWLRVWRARLTKTVRHHGNHRYLWCLDRRARRAVLAAPSLPYPKIGGV